MSNLCSEWNLTMLAQILRETRIKNLNQRSNPDSTIQLVMPPDPGSHPGMASFEYSRPSTLYRVDRERNMQRFYSLSTSPTLFGGASLVREWGRIGSIGRRRVDLFETTAEAEAAQDEIVRTKRARGYQSDRGP